ncbi:MAG: hypothetical protein U1F11_02445 [Steroidobacteraceae bacterium]
MPERGPRTISMRSTCSSGMSWNEASPALVEPTRTPSMSTSVWSDSAPRTNTVLGLPMPPLLVTETPATPRSSSSTSCAWRRSMVVRSMTVTEASVLASGSGTRRAVTTTVCRGSSSGAAAASATAVGMTANSAAQPRARRGLIFEHSTRGCAPAAG